MVGARGLEYEDSSTRTRVRGLEYDDSSTRTRVRGLEYEDSSTRFARDPSIGDGARRSRISVEGFCQIRSRISVEGFSPRDAAVRPRARRAHGLLPRASTEGFYRGLLPRADGSGLLCAPCLSCLPSRVRAPPPAPRGTPRARLPAARRRPAAAPPRAHTCSHKAGGKAGRLRETYILPYVECTRIRAN